MKKPFISVLMGVYYKKEDTTALFNSVTSILNQSVSDLELIICDDGSTADAKNLLEELAKKDSRIRFVRKGNLLTLPQKLNACLKEAKGDLIARMDDDDYSHPRRFEKQIEYLEQHSEVKFVGCNVNLYCNGIFISKKEFPEFPKVENFYFTQPFIHPTLLFRRDVIFAIDGYSEEKHCILCEDYDLLLRLYAKGFIGANLQDVFFDYSIPNTAKGNRKMWHRWNESVTRYYRFKELKILHRTVPYIIKPLIVGLIPENLLAKLKGLR